MEKKASLVKTEIEQYYDQLGTKKSIDIDTWLKSGDKIRLPETESGNYFLDRKLQRALELAKLDNNANILEIGCQYGYFTFRLAHLGFNVTSVDLSNRAIEIAKRRAKYYGVTNISFMQADAEHLNILKDESFDAIFSFSCLRYLPNPAKALSELYRIVRSSGKIIVDFPNKHSPWFNFIRPIIGIKPHIHDHLYSGSEVKQMILDTGFKSVKIEKMLFTPRKAPSILLPFFKLMDLFGERMYGFREFAAIIVCYGEK